MSKHDANAAWDQLQELLSEGPEAVDTGNDERPDATSDHDSSARDPRDHPLHHAEEAVPGPVIGEINERDMRIDRVRDLHD
jgi:hypothetical protein